MVIRDVIHNDITIGSDLIINLLQTPEFQRLRRIKQLGLTYLVFPGAEHSRYTHSIGVYHLGKQFIQELEKKRGIRFDSKEQRALEVALLLHDVGHGPFSHTSEEVFEYFHEDLTIAIILNPCGNIFPILNEAKMVDDVVKFIKKTHENQVLNSILSSAIDADRMDYLIRDSYFSGVVYGQFDVRRLLKHVNADDEKLIFPQAAIHTIEDFIFSRYHMFNQVYLNEKTLLFEQILKQLLFRVKVLEDTDYLFHTNINLLMPFFKKEFSISQFLELDDYKLLGIIDKLQYEIDPFMASLAKAFMTQANVSVDKPRLKQNQGLIEIVVPSHEKKLLREHEDIYIQLEDKSIEPIQKVSPLIEFSLKEVKIKSRELRCFVVYEQK
ncbi:MAG: HD domain-containing protein [Mycoplasmatales bacterium]